MWRKWNLQPWKTETFKFSTSPKLEAKILDIVALYLDPPERAGSETVLTGRDRDCGTKVPGPA